MASTIGYSKLSDGSEGSDSPTRRSVPQIVVGEQCFNARDDTDSSLLVTVDVNEAVEPEFSNSNFHAGYNQSNMESEIEEEFTSQHAEPAEKIPNNAYEVDESMMTSIMEHLESTYDNFKSEDKDDSLNLNQKGDADETPEMHVELDDSHIGSAEVVENISDLEKDGVGVGANTTLHVSDEAHNIMLNSVPETLELDNAMPSTKETNIDNDKEPPVTQNLKLHIIPDQEQGGSEQVIAILDSEASEPNTPEIMTEVTAYRSQPPKHWVRLCMLVFHTADIIYQVHLFVLVLVFTYFHGII